MLPVNLNWGEFIRGEDDYWKGLRKSLVAFIAIDPIKKIPQHLGAGFIVFVAEHSDKKYIAALTAKHVLEHAYRYQNIQRYERRAANAPSVLFKDSVELDDMKLRALWMGDSTADVMRVRYIDFLDGHDLALVLLEPQEICDPSVFQKIALIPFDVRVPPVGAVVHLVSLTEYDIQGPFLEHGELSEVRNRPFVRWAKVTQHNVESMGHKGTSFTVSCPTISGMSGGFVYLPEQGGTIGACGIISSSEEPQILGAEGASTNIVSIRSALGLHLPKTLDQPATKLVEFIRQGVLRDITKGPEKFSYNIHDDGVVIQILN